MLPGISPENGEVSENDESLDKDLNEEKVDERQRLRECEELEDLDDCRDGILHLDALPDRVVISQIWSEITKVSKVKVFSHCVKSEIWPNPCIWNERVVFKT